MLLLLSKHRYQAIPVSLKSVQVTDTTYLPPASLPLDTETQILVQTNKLIQNMRVNSTR